jgi:ACR3 family arsenite efflux pump ArsB
VALAVSQSGLNFGAALATVVAVRVAVPEKLSLCWLVKRVAPASVPVSVRAS